MSEILFIPGCGTQTRKDYPKLVGALESRGHHIIPITMDWDVESDPRAWADQVHSQLGDVPRIDIGIGHSYGSMTLLQVASDWTQREKSLPSFPKLLFLGHSARYLDDQDAYPNVIREHAKDLNPLDRFPPAFEDLVIGPNVATIRMHLESEEVTVFVGEEEGRKSPPQRRRALSLSQLFESQLVTIPGAPHDFDDTPLYVDEIMGKVDIYSGV
ncbi:MAG TPA: alpha/beta hydrolase [Candidatus Saccharimonadales bacterium]|nr:alpha/beta hydrolase [Candidatus Saccharimonadales bacterium]